MEQTRFYAKVYYLFCGFINFIVKFTVLCWQHRRQQNTITITVVFTELSSDQAVT